MEDKRAGLIHNGHGINRSEHSPSGTLAVQAFLLPEPMDTTGTDTTILDQLLANDKYLEFLAGGGVDKVGDKQIYYLTKLTVTSFRRTLPEIINQPEAYSQLINVCENAKIWMADATMH